MKTMVKYQLTRTAATQLQSFNATEKYGPDVVKSSNF